LNIAIVYNSFAGNGKAERLAKDLGKKLTVRMISHEFFDVPWSNNFETFTDIWIIGGDGTLNCFINKFPTISLPMIVFSGGTGNDFQSMLYAGKTLDELFEIGLGADTVWVDAAYCNEKIFINGLGIGFEGMVALDLSGKNKKFGKTSYWISIFQRLFLYKEQSYEIIIGKEHIADRFLILDVMNGYRAGGGFNIAPGASPFDGELLLVMISHLPWYKRLFYVPIIEKGMHLGYPFVRTRTVTNLIISSNKAMNAHIDGELIQATEFSINIKSRAFRFKQ
jgi:diacylglycerol kinase family enzyme